MDEIKRFVVRMDSALHVELAAVAKKSMRSFNSEVLHRLKNSLRLNQSEPIAEPHEGFEIAPSELLLLTRFRSLSAEERMAIVSMLTDQHTEMPLEPPT